MCIGFINGRILTMNGREVKAITIKETYIERVGQKIIINDVDDVVDLKSASTN